MEIENMSGEELYNLFLGGSEPAFEKLVELYQDELARFINSMLRDYQEAKYLTIETFAQLVLNKKKFDGNSTIKTYLFAIGKNLALRCIRKRAKEQQHIPYEEIAEVLSDENETPDNIVERKDTQHLLRDAVSKLKKDHRVVLTLIYFEDMSYIQAGNFMGKSETQIRGLAHRAKAALKKQLETYGHTWS
jgi:RNA polymerase sigma-70 factor (ECF subfamily)